MSPEHHDRDDAPALRAWLDAARDDLGAREPPVWLEFQLRERLAERAALIGVRGARESQALNTAIAGVREPPRAAAAKWLGAITHRLPRAWPALASLATACVALVIGLALLNPMYAPPPSAPGAADAQAQGERSPFIALTSLDAIAAESGVTVVPARLPRTSLVDFGLPVDPARADVPLIAEFLMSPRGVVLAVRFVE